MGGKPYFRIDVKCLNCGDTFNVIKSRYDRGNTMFCSKKCYNEGRITTRVADRFWRKICKTESCWIWKGTIDKRGYGEFTIVRKKYRTHRYSYTLKYGEIPSDLLACHTCDNPSCVNPDHIFLGTSSDNIADMVKKGRQAKGNTHGSKTHPENIDRVTKIARMFNVGHKIISNIKTGKTWKHLV